jgi:hypothetical protein
MWVVQIAACPPKETFMEKKQIAALSAVMMLLKQEASKRARELSYPSLFTLSSRWSVYGRQMVMHMRGRVQRRIQNTHLPVPFVGKSVPMRGVLLHRVKTHLISSHRTSFRVPRTSPKEKSIEG